MSYDDDICETKEDRAYRLEAPARRRAARQQYLEDNCDAILEERRECALERDNEPFWKED